MRNHLIKRRSFARSKRRAISPIRFCRRPRRLDSIEAALATLITRAEAIETDIAKNGDRHAELLAAMRDLRDQAWQAIGQDIAARYPQTLDRLKDE